MLECVQGLVGSVYILVRSSTLSQILVGYGSVSSGLVRPGRVWQGLVESARHRRRSVDAAAQRRWPHHGLDPAPPWRRSWTFGCPSEVKLCVGVVGDLAESLIRAYDPGARIERTNMDELHISWH